MSTNSTPQSHRSTRRSNATADQSSPPSASPTGVKRRRGRPSLEKKTTDSSTSSKLSETFDVDKSTLPRPHSPTTPPCDTSLPCREKEKPKVDPVVQEPDDLYHSKSMTDRKRAVAHITPSKSAASAIALSRQPSDPTALGNAVAGSKAGSIPYNMYLIPGTNASRHQRASSAPTPLLWRREGSFNVDRLPELPGRYESQDSNAETEIKRENESMSPSIIVDQDEVDFGDGQFDALPDDHEVDDDSPTFAGARLSVRLNAAPGDTVEPQLSPFRPFTCEKGQPMKRRVIDQRSNNNDIWELIQKEEKRGKQGWVYIAESQEYGPEKLKIGMTNKSPHKRIYKLQECGLKLQEIPNINQNPLYHFELLEKVVHLELINQRLKLMRHQPNGEVKFRTEWFEVDRERALAVVEKWRSWLLIQEPFDSQGTLTPYWRSRLGEIKGRIADVDWQSWTQPSIWHYHVFLVKSHFAPSRKDATFLSTSAVVTLLSFLGHGGKGAFWAVMFLLLL